MKLVTTWFGVFVMDDDNIIEHTLFPKDADEIARRMSAIQKGDILAEEEEMAGGKQVFVFDERLEMLGELLFDSPPFVSPDDYDFPGQLLNQAMIAVTKGQLRESGTPDQQIVQAIRAMDDLDRTMNLLSERLHEWHELNFPELPKLVSEEDYIKLIAKHGDRKNILANTKIDIDSMGSEVEPEDAEAMKQMAGNIITAMESRRNLEKFVQDRMKNFAPNTAQIAGPLVGARLISLAGGMERLARLPTSTIQILGAEKAFFKHIKENVRPPKHGIIFQNPLVHRAPYWQRGNISRALAGTISIAVKVDHYGDGKYIADELQNDLDKRVAEIKNKYPDQPERKRSQRHKSGDRGGGKGGGKKPQGKGGQYHKGGHKKYKSRKK